MKKLICLERLVVLWVSLLMCTFITQAQTVVFSQDFTGPSTDPADYGFTVTGSTVDGMSATVTDGKLVLVSGNYSTASKSYDAKASFTAISSGNEVTFSCTWATGNATGNDTQSYSRLILSDGANEALNIIYYGQPQTLCVNGVQVKEKVARSGTYAVSATLNMNTKKITALSVGSVYSASEAISFYSSDCTSISTFQFSHYARASWTNTSSVDNVSISYEEIEEVDPRTTAFSQDFTTVGESIDPVDYGFALTYGAGSSSSLVNFSVADGVLKCVAGPYGSPSAGARTGTATATFTEIGSKNEVTLTYKWALGSATGNASGSYTKTRIGNATGNALELSFYGSEDNGSLKVNGTTVKSGNTAIRNTTYTVSATLNLFTKKITALILTCSNATFSYELAEPIDFASAISSIDRFAFENSERQSWANTSSVDDVVVKYQALPAPEAIASVVITGAERMTFGADPNTAASNAYSVVITGEEGTVITEANLSAMVEDFKVVWDIEGFQTENDTEGQYCDSYGAFSVNNAGQVATTFELKNVPMNFFGKMKTTITYYGNEYVAEKYVVALGDQSKAANQVLPLAGYPKSFSAYADALTGYQVTGETYGNSSDLLLGGWCVAGSDVSDGKLLADNDGTKYVRLTASALKRSHVLIIGTPTAQLIFRNKLRFNNAGAVVTLTGGYPFWSSSKYTCPVTLSYDGNKISLNGTALKNGETEAQFATGTWYDIVLSVDTTTESSYALVYNTNGELLAQSGNIAWTETSNPTYFSIGMDNSTTGSVDIASYEAFTPVADNNSYTLTADKTTISIPNKETATLTASLSDENGYAMTQAAAWTVLEEDMREFIVFTPNKSDSHQAVVSIADGAEAGTVTVQVNIGGVTKTIELTLTSSTESVKFTQSTTSITIPMDAGETTTANFTAIVVDGSGNDLERTVSLTAYQQDGTTPFVNTDAISFDAATGILSVNGMASPTYLVITASGKNTNDETITKSVRVNIHGMKFDFGLTDEDAIAEGFTAVDASASYSAVSGYGIVSGTATVGGSASATDATMDYLEGAFEFDFKATLGEFYTVEITYQGTLSTGYINSDLNGYVLGSSETMTTATFIIPATTDVIDLHIADNGNAKARIAQITVTKQAKRTKRNKPVVHHIGDSTSANNGSWAYRLAGMSGTYSELFGLCTFQNNGAGGRNLSTYYTEGKLASVLRDIYPDDIVMFGNNGTNGMGSSFEADVNYYLNAAEALGAKIIINSYTPHGAVGNYASGYNAATHTFDSYRKDSYETIVRKVAEERAASDASYLGFVEIGKNADAAFNAYVADYATNGYATADAAAQTIIGCFTDHNHYYNKDTQTNPLVGDLMLNGYGEVKGIVAQLVEILETAAHTPYPLNISAWGWNTYSCQIPVSFDEGTEAYIAVKADDDKVVLRRVNAVPANTGILVKGTPGEKAGISYADGVTDNVEDNLLVGTAEGAVNINSGYVLSATAEAGSLGFYRLASTKRIPRYSAYLPVSNVQGSRSVMFFGIEDSEVTGISHTATGSVVGKADIYDLQGRKMENLRKGLNIVCEPGKGVKKIVVK